ncbi:MAG: resolvase, partial [Bacteroidales bacterium]|nr:resolvase [Bacteroidales bacterium]
RYLTNRPKLIANQELRQIALQITKSYEDEMRKRLNKWHDKWNDFLKEKTFNSETGKWFYTHKRLRSAFRSINKNLPILYTY